MTVNGLSWNQEDLGLMVWEAAQFPSIGIRFIDTRINGEYLYDFAECGNHKEKSTLLVFHDRSVEECKYRNIGVKYDSRRFVVNCGVDLQREGPCYKWIDKPGFLNEFEH